MKQYSFIIALATLIAFSGQSVAQTATTTPTPMPWKQEMSENRALIREKRDAFMQTVKEDRGDLQEERRGFLGVLKERRNTLEEEIKARREALKTEIETIKKERATARKTFVENKFRQVMIVLTNHQERLQNKIDELTGQGFDMAAAQTHLDEAEDSLAEATTLLATLTAAQISDTNDATLVKPRETAKKIEDALKETRMHLVESIHAIKDAIGEDDRDETASTAN